MLPRMSVAVEVASSYIYISSLLLTNFSLDIKEVEHFSIFCNERSFILFRKGCYCRDVIGSFYRKKSNVCVCSQKTGVSRNFLSEFVDFHYSATLSLGLFRVFSTVQLNQNCIFLGTPLLCERQKI